MIQLSWTRPNIVSGVTKIKDAFASFGDGIDAAHEQLDLTSKVQLKTLWTPYSADVYPASDLTSTGWTIGAGNVGTFFPSGYKSVLYNDPKINAQSQKWVPIDPGNPSSGAKNNPTARTSAGAVMDISFELNDDRFSLMTALYPNLDVQIYASDENGQMRRLTARPLVFTTADYSFGFLDVRFASRRTRTIRIVCAHIVFYQILYSTYGTLRKTPDLPMSLVVGDSYREATGMLNIGPGPSFTPSSESYATMAISDFGQMRTGWAQARLAMGGSGYFQNGSGVASDLPGPDGTVPFFSDANVNKIKAYGKNTIRLIEVNGTINDGELSGGKAGMKARALEGINKIYTWDRGIRFVLWGPEPLSMDDSTPANNIGTVHDLNRQALIEVAAEHPAVIGFIDCSNPYTPFWTGIGSEASPNAFSAQAAMLGMDGIHYNYKGGQHYAHMGYNIMGEFYIEKVREIVE